MTIPDTVTYIFDINMTDTPGGRCYLAELQCRELTLAECELDDEVLSERVTDWDNPDGREALENGCVGWGPTIDQNLVVFTEDGLDTNVVTVMDIEDALTDGFVHDMEHHLAYDKEGKHVIGVHFEKGSYRGELVLPASEEFDPDKVTFGTVCMADSWTIVSTVQYNGEDVYMEGDSTGKSYDIYTFENDEVTALC